MDWHLSVVLLILAGLFFFGMRAGFNQEWTAIAWIGAMMSAAAVGYSTGAFGFVIKTIWFR